MTYDIITIGGGLGGASLAKAMAEHGAKVLVLEREKAFKDRVRGEVMWPWGCIELKQLGLYELLRDKCARAVSWLDLYIGGTLLNHRDLSATSIQKLPALNWVHHEMEETLLEAAIKAGAEVRRGANVNGITFGQLPGVSVEQDGTVEDLRARLIVCADGRGSMARKWGGFSVKNDVEGMLIGGVLCDSMPSESGKANHWILNPSAGHFVFLSPQNAGRTRAYAWHPKEMNYRFQGTADLPRFIEDSLMAGAPADWYAQLRPIGPLATFDGTDSWVDHPYKDGVLLLGDAAAANDPSYGQGQCLAVRDVRVLRDLLLAEEDWDKAGHTYAEEHDRQYGAIHKVTGWVRELFYQIGPAADARRARAFPLLTEDMSRMPDVLMSGPDIQLDEEVRARFFGEQ